MGCCRSLAAAVVGPVPGPGSNSTSSIGLILTTEPQGPYALLPSGTSNTTSPKPPDAVLLENCTLSSYDSTGKVVYSTSVPANTEPVGPCQLIMDKNGTLYIRDLGGDGTVVWSNELLTNRTAATCSPYSLSVLTNGVIVERDCQNRTVWSVPQLGGACSAARTAPMCAACTLTRPVHGVSSCQQRMELGWVLALSIWTVPCSRCRSGQPCARPQHHHQRRPGLHPHHRAAGPVCAAAGWHHQHQQHHRAGRCAAAQLQPHDVHHAGQQAGVCDAAGRACARGALQVSRLAGSWQDTPWTRNACFS
jgi:hypothetical protein